MHELNHITDNRLIPDYVKRDVNLQDGEIVFEYRTYYIVETIHRPGLDNWTAFREDTPHIQYYTDFSLQGIKQQIDQGFKDHET
jgi:hypothetical protein